MTKRSDPKGDMDELIPPTYEGLLEKYNTLKEFLGELKTAYMSLIQEDADYRNTSVRLPERQLTWLEKMDPKNKGNVSRAVRFIIDLAMTEEDLLLSKKRGVSA